MDDFARQLREFFDEREAARRRSPFGPPPGSGKGPLFNVTMLQEIQKLQRELQVQFDNSVPDDEMQDIETTAAIKDCKVYRLKKLRCHIHGADQCWFAAPTEE